MYVLEVFHKKEWEICKTSDKKKDLEDEAEDLNKLVHRDVLRFLPVSKKYRVRKIKRNEITDDKQNASFG